MQIIKRLQNFPIIPVLMPYAYVREENKPKTKKVIPEEIIIFMYEGC